MVFREFINILHIFDIEAAENQARLIESDQNLFLALAEDILEQHGCSREEASQLAAERFQVIVVRRDPGRQENHFEEHRLPAGYRLATYLIGRAGTITGGKMEAIACSLWMLGTRINVFHDIPFTLETARKTLSAVKESKNDQRWCLLLSSPRWRPSFWKGNSHIGIANLAYLKHGLLDTGWEVVNDGSEYCLAPVFKILVKAARSHGWRETYFSLVK